MTATIAPIGLKDAAYFWHNVCFSVEGYLFQVSRQQFIQGSEYFAEKYGLCEPMNGLDVTNDTPVVELEGVTASQFRTFLKLVFPSLTTSTNLTLTKDEWRTILTLSTLWNFHEFRNLAIQHIDPYLTNPIGLVQLGRAAYVLKWVLAGYEGLVQRSEVITEDECDMIGDRTVNRLYIIRHTLSHQSAFPDPEKSVSRELRSRFSQEFSVLENEGMARRTKAEHEEDLKKAEEKLRAEAEEEELRLKREEASERERLERQEAEELERCRFEEMERIEREELERLEMEEAERYLLEEIEMYEAEQLERAQQEFEAELDRRRWEEMEKDRLIEEAERYRLEEMEQRRLDEEAATQEMERCRLEDAERCCRLKAEAEAERYRKEVERCRLEAEDERYRQEMEQRRLEEEAERDRQEMEQCKLEQKGEMELAARQLVEEKECQFMLLIFTSEEEYLNRQLEACKERRRLAEEMHQKLKGGSIRPEEEIRSTLPGLGKKGKKKAAKLREAARQLEAARRDAELRAEASVNMPDPSMIS